MNAFRKAATEAATKRATSRASEKVCEHEWFYWPVVDTNPEQHARKCFLCGRIEAREGPTVTFGETIPATEWEEQTVWLRGAS